MFIDAGAKKPCTALFQYRPAPRLRPAGGEDRGAIGREAIGDVPHNVCGEACGAICGEVRAGKKPIAAPLRSATPITSSSLLRNGHRPARTGARRNERPPRRYDARSPPRGGCCRRAKRRASRRDFTQNFTAFFTHYITAKNTQNSSANNI